MEPPSTRDPRGAAGLLALPDDLIIRCLQCLSQHERFQHAALVSKRFQRLCLAPQLLRTVTLYFTEEDCERCCDSLLNFLTQNGEHVRSLHIDGGFDFSDAQLQLAADLVTACLTACGAAGKLEELHVGLDTPLTSTAWLAGLTACRQLRLGHEYQPLRLPPSFSQLTALTDAELTGTPIELGTAASLPPALTRLRLINSSATTLPCQITSLNALARLDLFDGRYAADSLAMLARLPSLRKLWLTSFGSQPGLPPSLSTVKQLEQLIVCCHYSGATAVLAAALPSLSGLSSLCLDLRAPLGSLTAVAQLPRLQRLLLASSVAHHANADNLALPPGPWLRSIRWLGLPWPALEAGVEVLRGAPQLEYIFSDGEPRRASFVKWRAFWQFVATHPPLRCMAFVLAGGFIELPLVDAVFLLHQRRPRLQLRRLPDSIEFSHEVDTWADIPPGPGGNP